MRDDLTLAEHELHASQGEYQDMQKERDSLLKDVQLAEAQIQELHRLF